MLNSQSSLSQMVFECTCFDEVLNWDLVVYAVTKGY